MPSSHSGLQRADRPQSPVLVRIAVLAAHQAVDAQRVGRGHGRRAEDEGLAAAQQVVVEAEEGAGLGDARLFPVEEVLAGEGQLGRGLDLHRDGFARQEQFLGFGARDREQLAQVQRRLAVAQAVHRAEHGLAPEHGVAAQLDVDRHLAEIELAEHEGVEQFARRAVEVAVGLVAQAERRAGRSPCGWRRPGGRCPGPRRRASYQPAPLTRKPKRSW